MPWEDHEEDETTPDGSDNPNFKQLRDYAKKLEKQLTKATKDLEGLSAFKAEVEAQQRQTAVAQVFSEVGLSEKHAALFARLNPEGDVTADAVRSFAQEFELPVRTTDDTPAQEQTSQVDWSKEQIVQTQPSGGEVQAPPAPQGFAPVQSAGTPNAGIISNPDEAAKLYATNQEEFIRLREAGRIQLDTLPGNR